MGSQRREPHLRARECPGKAVSESHHRGIAVECEVAGEGGQGAG